MGRRPNLNASVGPKLWQFETCQTAMFPATGNLEGRVERGSSMANEVPMYMTLNPQDPQQNFPKVMRIFPSVLHSHIQPNSWQFTPFLDSQSLQNQFR